MMRRNILAGSEIADAFLRGVLTLKDPDRSPWPGNPGLSVYDFFVFWHARTMMVLTPPTQNDRNAAHSGPGFLPWHRYMLLRFEERLQAALDDTSFRLPYWDWTADAAMTDPRQSQVWRPEALGRFEQDDFRVRVGMNAAGAIVRVDRQLRRAIGARGQLPSKNAVAAAVRTESRYDTPPYNSDSSGFRNVLEGWIGDGSIHNIVHVWVGGDMQLATSPNDPCFFLHHCNVDRLWSAWQAAWPASPYLPGPDASEELRFHRLDDPLYTFFDEEVTPADVLNHDTSYVYDSLAL